MAELLSGRAAAAAIRADVAARIAQLGFAPRLALLRVGDDPDDLAYIRSIERQCETVGAETEQFTLPLGCNTEDLLRSIDTVNRRADLHGCLLLRPLPAGIDEHAVCDALLPEKDIDGMSSQSLGALFVGNRRAFAPCTAQACMELLDYYGIDLTGRNVAVIGRSLVIGKPVSMMLQARNATVTMCHTRTAGLASVCRNAEILVAAAGKAGLVTSEFVRKEQIVIDVGINVNEEGKLCGDVDFDEVEPIVSAITPVPAGVGSVTTAVLAKHVIEAAERVFHRRAFQ